MAKMPTEADLGRKIYRASSPQVRFPVPDFSPLEKGAKAISEGLASLASADNEAQSHDVQRRMLDFKLETEMALEEAKRSMPVGGEGYAAKWQEDYRKRAGQFVGRGDANIPQALQARVGTMLKQHEVMLGERAQRDELAERDRHTSEQLSGTLTRTRSAIEANPDRVSELQAEGEALITTSRLTPAARDVMKKRWREHAQEAAASTLADGVRDAESFRRARELLGPDKAERVTAKGVKQGILGSVSAKYESGDRGVGFVSTGQDDPGGPSYGVHQLSSKDSMPAFLRSEEGKPYAERFAGLKPGTSGFNTRYREIAAADADGFAKAQFAFYERTHYQPLRARAEAKGFDVSNRGVQEALFSMAIQHGGAAKIVEAADAGGSSEQQIRSLYASRARYVSGLSDLPATTKSSVLNRYRSEERDALTFARSMPADAPTAAWAGEGDTQQPGAEGTTALAEYAGPFQDLSLAKRRTLMQRAESRMTAVKTGVEQAIRSQMTVATDGYAPPAGVLDALRNQVAAVDDPMLHAQLDTLERQAALTQHFQRVPPQASEAYAADLRERAGQLGATKEQLDAIKHIEAVAASTRRHLSEDAIAHANKIGLVVPMADGPPADLEPAHRPHWRMPTAKVELEQIGFGHPDIDRMLAQRFEWAKAIGRYYGTPPPSPFTKIEAEGLTAMLRRGGAHMPVIFAKIATAATRAGIEPAVVMKQFTKADAPELAVIGEMVASNADPAIVNTAAAALSWRATQGEKFVSTIDKQQAQPTLGDYASVLSTQPMKVDAVRQTANLLYEYEARRKGVTTFDPALYGDIVAKIMGRTTDADGTAYGGVGTQGAGWRDGKWSTKVLVPSAIRQDSVDAMIGALRAQDLPDPPVDADGKPLSIRDIRSATWVSLGPGIYVLERSRDATGERVLAFSRSGKPYTLDIRPLLPAIQQRRPDIFRGYDGNARGINAPDPDYAFGWSDPPSPDVAPAAEPGSVPQQKTPLSRLAPTDDPESIAPHMVLRRRIEDERARSAQERALGIDAPQEILRNPGQRRRHPLQ